MQTYSELMEQSNQLIEQSKQLQERAALARKAELADVVLEIKERILSFGISAADLGYAPLKVKRVKKVVAGVEVPA